MVRMASLWACFGLWIVVFAQFSRGDLEHLELSEWTIRNGNGSIRLQAKVPSSVHSVLVDEGLLADPYFRFNEREQRWVSEEVWEYSTCFEAKVEWFVSETNVELVFEGIDTVGEVYINDEHVLSTANMHRRWVIDAKRWLVQGKNNISVVIQPASSYGHRQSLAYPYELPLSDTVVAIPYRNFVRKAQSDFGWDWGPGFAPCGLWRPITLKVFNEPFLDDVTVQQYLTNDLRLARLNVTAYVRSSTAGFDRSNGPYSLHIFLEGVNNSQRSLILASSNQRSETEELSIMLEVKNPQLWWPVGYGEPRLYTLVVQLTSPSKGTIYSLRRKIGFRKISIIRKSTPPETSKGLSFYFEVNSVPIFIKGANVVPMHAFHTRVTKSYLETMLENAKLANMNMVRVWGGGIYQPDEFYDYCDRNGLLVWQEFAFACATYPRDTAFLNNVRVEVGEQARRIGWHPSVAVFGGNNENEVGMTWYPLTRENAVLYSVDYVKLYVDTVRDEILHHLPSANFVVSSPSNGPLSEDPFVLRWGDANSADWGDMHFYDYFSDCADPDTYPSARFISEFGFQSLPSLYSWKNVSHPSDWNFNSSLLFYRQRHAQGNAQLLAQMRRQFAVPDFNETSEATFDTYVYLTQTTQSLCYQTAFEKWRRLSQNLHTMGIIYWQLNDIWQAPSWASVEFENRWKLLHYTIRRVFKPLIISMVRNGSSLEGHVISDFNHPIETAVGFELRSWSDGSIIHKWNQNFEAAPFSSVTIFRQEVIDVLKGNAETDVFLFVSLAGKTSGELFDTSHFVFTKFNQIALRDPDLRVSHFSSDNGKFSFTLTANTPAPFVFLETPFDGVFSANAFFAVPGCYNISFKYQERNTRLGDLQAFQETMKVRSLFSTIPKAVFTSS